MKKLIWVLPALLLSAPAWSWCDNDSDDPGPSICPHNVNVPEPATLALMVLGASGLLIARRRRKGGGTD